MGTRSCRILRTATLLILTASTSAFLGSCTSTKEPSFSPKHKISEEELNAKKETLRCTFAGDIMAHAVNFSQGHFDEIYADIKGYLQESQLSFANLEAPVDDALPYSAYPEFNMHHEYADAAVSAGFNVFSLANNHTNDHGKNGIAATRTYFEQRKKNQRTVWSNGLCKTQGEKMKPTLIECDGWKVLFLSVTEVLNKKIDLDWFYIVRPNQKEREAFKKELTQMREENPCDIFVLAFHCADPEYKLGISEEQRTFYRSLLECGVDVLWANHPHVAKDWEVIADENRIPRKIIFFAQGNTISGQRQEFKFDEPDNPRAYTGDGYITEVEFSRGEKDGVQIELVSPHLITTYITPEWRFVIRELDDDFITELSQSGRTSWARYLGERKKRMEQIEGKLIWQ